MLDRLFADAVAVGPALLLPPSADLPDGARVGTSSLRRRAQLLHAHPHLNIVPVRGNIDARVRMLQEGQLDAIVLAAAGEMLSPHSAMGAFCLLVACGGVCLWREGLH